MQENLVFSTRFTADYLDIRPDLTISFARLMAYIQEASLLHTKAAGYSMEWFAQKQQAFVLTHWQVEVNSCPKWNQEFEIQTWPAGFKGFMAERSFLARDLSGNVLARANSNWIFLDLNKKDPLRPTPEMTAKYGTQFPRPLPKDFKLPGENEFSVIGENALTVSRSDIDTNLHVNNVRYLQWVMNSIGDELYNIKQIRSMKAYYKKECVRGQELIIETRGRKGEESGETECLSVIRDRTDPNLVFTEVWTRWA